MSALLRGRGAVRRRDSEVGEVEAGCHHAGHEDLLRAGRRCDLPVAGRHELLRPLPGRRPVAAEPAALPPSMRNRVPFLLFRASQASLSLANQMLARIGLCARQAGILTMVTELAPMTQKALADALGIDRTTMVALLDDLENKGYVARQRHPRDRRAFLIYPTDSGRAAKAAAVRILDQQQRRFLAPLTPAERTQLADLLTRLHRRRTPGQ